MGRTILVAGGAQGLGRLVALSLQANGHRVAVAEWEESTPLSRLRLSTGLPAWCWDLADSSACAAGLAQVERGLGPVEVLINHAWPLPMSEISRTQSILEGAAACLCLSRAVLPSMRARRYGRIVNIAPPPDQEGGWRAGTFGFTRPLRLGGRQADLAMQAIGQWQGPSSGEAAVLHDSRPLAFLGSPQDVARAVLFMIDGGPTGEKNSVDRAFR